MDVRYRLSYFSKVDVRLRSLKLANLSIRRQVNAESRRAQYDSTSTFIERRRMLVIDFLGTVCSSFTMTMHDRFFIRLCCVEEVLACVPRHSLTLVKL